MAIPGVSPIMLFDGFPKKKNSTKKEHLVSSVTNPNSLFAPCLLIPLS